MKEYKCNKCERCFRQKCHLVDHLNKKTSCDTDINELFSSKNQSKNSTISLTKNIFSTNLSQSNINQIDGETLRKYLNENKCAYCGKKFTKKSCVIVHIKNSCKKRKTLYSYC